jgi:hypothetical protein
MFRTHKAVAEAEVRLSELRSLQSLEEDAAKKTDIGIQIRMLEKTLAELRWAHTPAPMVTPESIAAAEFTDDKNVDQPMELSTERVY